MGKNNLSDSIVLFTLLWWFGTKSAVSPRSAIMGVGGAHRRWSISQGSKASGQWAYGSREDKTPIWLKHTLLQETIKNHGRKRVNPSPYNRYFRKIFFLDSIVKKRNFIMPPQALCYALCNRKWKWGSPVFHPGSMKAVGGGCRRVGGAEVYMVSRAGELLSINSVCTFSQASQVVQIVRNPPAIQEMQVWSLGWEDPLEEKVTTYSSILTWRIPRTEENGGLQ